ncbi:MAG: hypothetical protein R2810_13335 [Flavobacteriales bacterium]
MQTIRTGPVPGVRKPPSCATCAWIRPPGGLVTLVVVGPGGAHRAYAAGPRGVRTRGYYIPVELDVLDWPPGRYALHLHTS